MAGAISIRSAPRPATCWPAVAKARQAADLANWDDAMRRREMEYTAGELDAAGLVGSVRAVTGILNFWGLKGLAQSALDV